MNRLTITVAAYLLTIFSLVLSGCDKKEATPTPEPPGQTPSWINVEFARALQVLGYIEDASTVSPEDVADITRLDLDPLADSPETIWLTSLKGIEHFKSLEFLLLGVNRVDSLDLSYLSNLKYVDCGHNRLVTLNLTGLSSLETLFCDRNQLQALDMSDCGALQYVACGKNQLKALDVSSNPKLETLYCSENLLTALDLSTNKSLRLLDCSVNFDLTDIILPVDGSLQSIDCSCMGGTQLTVPDNPDLKKIICSSSKLRHLSGTGLSVVESIDISGSHIPQAELRSLVHLRNLKCNNMGWVQGDFSDNFELEELSCVGNEMAEINLRGNLKLRILDCSDNNLNAIDILHNTELIRLNVNKNQLTTLDTEGLHDLNWLSVSHNYLSSLALEGNGKLQYLDCSDNLLDGLDVSYCPGLQNLNVTGNPGQDRTFRLFTGNNPSLTISSEYWPYNSWHVMLEKVGGQ